MKNRRLLACTFGLFGLGVALVGLRVLGDPSRATKERRSTVPTPAQERADEEKGVSRFLGQPVIGYQNANGEGLVAIQLQPELVGAALPRDLVVVVDTSASQAQGPLSGSSRIIRGLFKQMQPTDRVGLVVANLDPVALTRGLVTTTEAIAALDKLDQEYASGATNLPKAVEMAAGMIEANAGRSRSILFMGDGISLANPMDGADRAKVVAELVRKEVPLFTVPMGARVDPTNLHGLATGSGGRCLRIVAGDAPEALGERIRAAIDAPVYYPRSMQAVAGMKEVYPSRLPPLRGDAPTLLVGSIVPGSRQIELSIDGSSRGVDSRLAIKHVTPPHEIENFFLGRMVSDWRDSKDLPSMVQADRALALAAAQGRLDREETLAKGNFALSIGRPEVAGRFFNEARRIDPSNIEAVQGLTLARKVADGSMPRQELMKTLGQINAAIQEEAKPAAEKPGAGAPGVEADFLEKQKQLADINLQKREAEIKSALSEASRAVGTDAIGQAKESLKQQLGGLQNDANVREDKRRQLTNQIEARLRELDKRGQSAEREERERQIAQIALEERRKEERSLAAQQDRVKERLRQFHALMNQAREELAQQQAQKIREDLVNQGLEVPAAVTAAYTMAQRGYYLRNLRDLVRVREEKWLAVLYEVERSHVPFPDEPPIIFPDSTSPVIKGRYKDWADLSKKRIDRYDTQGFGSNTPEATMKLRDTMSRVVDYPGLDVATAKVSEELDRLAKEHGISFEFNEQAFRAAGIEKVRDNEIGDPVPRMRATLGTIVRKLIARIKNNSPEGTATYVVRRDNVEITTSQFQLLDKVARAYPVADIVYGAPNSFAQSSVVQQSTLFGFGGSYGFAGQAAQNSFNGIGALNGLGQVGAAGAAMLGVVGGAGQAGAVGGALGAQQLGGQIGLGAVGNVGMQGQVGQFGQNGGTSQLGQFGNSGGQFGLQGGNYADVLVSTIRELVGRKSDWAAPIVLPGQQAADPLQQTDPNAGDQQERNQIGYFSPANALVIKGTSYIHTELYSNFVAPVGGAAPGGMGALPVKRPGALAAGNKPGDIKKDADPRKIWQDALARGVDDPGLIIAVSDFLAMNQMWDHATEFLKANLRKGIVVKPWVYESLALALRESGAAPAEIERAEVALADLEPRDADGYLKASRGMANLKRFDRAVALCRQAALVDPSNSRALEQGLRFSEIASDADGMAWAAGGLLKQEWPERNTELQGLAKRSLEAMAHRLGQQNRPEDRTRLLGNAAEQGRRDLVVHLSWLGDADLDLEVKEPTGSTCSTLTRRTPNGGTFVGDMPGDGPAERYVAAEAFSGSYEIRVRTAWGVPAGGKAQVRVIRFQGTDREVQEVFQVDVASGKPVRLNLADGRRSEMALVVPPRPREDVVAGGDRREDVFHSLRRMTEPYIPGSTSGIRGGAGNASQIMPQVDARVAHTSTSKERVYQNRVTAFMRNSMDVTSQIVLESERRQIRSTGSNLIDRPAK